MAVRKFQTTCCAMCIFSADNNEPFESLKFAVEKVKEDSKKEWHYSNRESGERSIQIVIMPGKENLEANVKKLGFTQIAKMNRRNGYPAGRLKLYMLSW